MSTGTQRNALEILLGMEPPKARTARVKLLQLSETAGEDVYFDIRALGYDRVREIQRMESGAEGNFQAAVILAGVTQPNLSDPELLEKYGAPTPYEVLPKFLSAGEIEELCRRIELLSGYRQNVTQLVKDIKKK